jgi:hypothetical protein
MYEFSVLTLAGVLVAIAAASFAYIGVQALNASRSWNQRTGQTWRTATRSAASQINCYLLFARHSRHCESEVCIRPACCLIPLYASIRKNRLRKRSSRPASNIRRKPARSISARSGLIITSFRCTKPIAPGTCVLANFRLEHLELLPFCIGKGFTASLRGNTG